MWQPDDIICHIDHMFIAFGCIRIYNKNEKEKTQNETDSNLISFTRFTVLLYHCYNYCRKNKIAGAKPLLCGIK